MSAELLAVEADSAKIENAVAVDIAALLKIRVASFECPDDSERHIKTL